MTDRLKDIRERLSAAGKDSWNWCGTYEKPMISVECRTRVEADGAGLLLRNAPEDIAYLLGEVDRLTEALGEVSMCGWDGHYANTVARKALGDNKEMAVLIDAEDRSVKGRTL